MRAPEQDTAALSIGDGQLKIPKGGVPQRAGLILVFCLLDSPQLNHPQPRTDGWLPSSAVGALVLTEERYDGGFIEMGRGGKRGVVFGVRHDEENFFRAERGVVHSLGVSRRADFVILARDE